MKPVLHSRTKSRGASCGSDAREARVVRTIPCGPGGSRRRLSHLIVKLAPRPETAPHAVQALAAITLRGNAMTRMPRPALRLLASALGALAFCTALAAEKST